MASMDEPGFTFRFHKADPTSCIRCLKKGKRYRDTPWCKACYDHLQASLKDSGKSK